MTRTRDHERRPRPLVAMLAVVLGFWFSTLVILSNPNVQANRERSAAGSGRIVIIRNGKLVVLERETRRVVWESVPLVQPYCFDVLPNGGYVVASHTTLVRLTNEGNQTTKVPLQFKFITDVTALENGNILVCDGTAGTISEIDWDGKISWSIEKLHHPSDAVRLRDGNTLVADGTAAIKEFDPNGKLVQTTWMKKWAGSVRRLPSGHTLVGGSTFFTMLDGDRNAVWSLDIASRITCVQQISENEYLICAPDLRRVMIVDTGGTVLWEFTDVWLWQALYLK